MLPPPKIDDVVAAVDAAAGEAAPKIFVAPATALPNILPAVVAVGAAAALANMLPDGEPPNALPPNSDEVAAVVAG